MASPFAVFRRNQKVLTVVLTCLAMFAFIILDSVSKMDSSAIMPIIFGLVGAALAWMWGSQNERGISYPTIVAGAIAGGIAGAVIISQSANQGGISTAHGRVSINELMEMKQKRDTVNQFVISAFRSRKEEVHPMMANYYLNSFLFGDTSNRGVIMKMLLEHEADELGIKISDEYITDFIKEVSDSDLTRERLTKIRSELRLGESELYDLLRSELRARVAGRILNPQVVHMPDQYWSDFEKLNVRHSIDAVAVPVEPFAARQPRPTDAEMKELFEAFKGVYPSGENPGFFQPYRLKLAWFESDYESAEKLVGEIPEEELRARYEERKEIEYKIETLPDLDSGFDDGGLKFGEPPAPAKTDSPANGEDTPEKPGTDASKTDGEKADDTSSKDGDSPAEPSKTPEPSSAKDAPEPSTEKSDDSKAAEESESPEECGDGDELDAESPTAGDPSDEQPSAEAKNQASEKKAADAEADSASKKGEDDSKTASENKKAAPEKDVESDATPPAEASPETNAADKSETTDKSDGKNDPEAPPVSEIKYRSFEEVRDEIRDLMLREKTEELMETQIADAITAVKDWRFNLREENPEISDEELAAAIAKKADAYAAENGLKFVNVTEFLSQQELIDHEKYRIGTAREPFDPATLMAQTQPQTAATRLFTGATTLFIPEEAEGQFDDTRYAFWATAEKEQHVPTFDEPGVREQVEQAVRMKNARPIAEARAKELAESVSKRLDESSVISLAEGIAGETVLGDDRSASSDADSDPKKSNDGTSDAETDEQEATDDDSTDGNDATEGDGSEKAESDDGDESDEPGNDALSVISSPPFTWLRQSSQGMQMNPFAQPSIEFGVIPGIDGVDNDFMQTVADTPVGDVVVIPNATKEIYYVVHVKARNPSGAGDPSLSPLRQQFITENAPMSPIYGQLAGSQAGEVNQSWFTQFMEKHSVDLAELDSI